MTGPPDDIAGLGLGGRDDGADTANALGGVGQRGAELAIDVRHESGAVEGARALGSPHVGGTDVLHGGGGDRAGRGRSGSGRRLRSGLLGGGGRLLRGGSRHLLDLGSGLLRGGLLEDRGLGGDLGNGVGGLETRGLGGGDGGVGGNGLTRLIGESVNTGVGQRAGGITDIRAIPGGVRAGGDDRERQTRGRGDSEAAARDRTGGGQRGKRGGGLAVTGLDA